MVEDLLSSYIPRTNPASGQEGIKSSALGPAASSNKALRWEVYLGNIVVERAGE